MNRLVWILLIIFWAITTKALAVEIGDKDWRQLTDTMGISYNELAGIYDVSTGRLLDESRHKIGQVDFSGWTWATAQDVYAMYSIIVGKTLESFDYYYEENPSWLFTFFNNMFEYTDRSHFNIGSASGIGRDGADQDSVIAMRVWVDIEDAAAEKYFGGVETQGVSKDGSSMANESRYGAYMYRTTKEELMDSPLAFSGQ